MPLSPGPDFIDLRNIESRDCFGEKKKIPLLLFKIRRQMNSLVSYSMKQRYLKAFFSDRRQFVFNIKSTIRLAGATSVLYTALHTAITR